MTDDVPETVTLALAWTKNGMRVKEQPRNLKLVAERHTATIWKPQRAPALLV